jgi:uncharacterized Ntn-hydrolase superfamily protein
MTWSIVARDETTGRIGIIVAAASLACGAGVGRVSTGVGAVASQGVLNPFLGPQAIALLKAGASAEDAVRLLMAADEGRGVRQIHVMDAEGNCAAHTGEACASWCGHEGCPGLSVAGDGLAGPEVVAAAVNAYAENMGTTLALRLIASMQAGEAAGGEKGGRQSAALLVHDREEYPLLDLRVDHHDDPLAELSRLEGIARERWLHFRRVLPSAARPGGLTDPGQIEEAVAKSIAEGYA